MPKPDAFGRRQWLGGSTTTSTSTSSLLTAVVIILAVVSISSIIFVFEIVAQNILKIHDNIKLPDDTDVSVRIKGTGSNFIVGATFASGTLACLCGLALWELRSSERWNSNPSRMRTWTWVNIAATVINLGLVVACLGVVFALQYGDGDLVPKLAEIGGYTNSYFHEEWVGATYETFMCGLKDLEGWNATWAKVGCGFTLASRWMLIPLVMASAALLVFCGHQTWRRHFSRVAQSGGTAYPLW